MGFSSQAISVRSSINLSDINIDTDLNMGTNSIIGYIPTSNINDYMKDLITEDDKKVFILGTPTVNTQSDLTEYSTYQSAAETIRLSYTSTANRFIKFKTQANLKTSIATYGVSTITTYFKGVNVNSQTGKTTSYQTRTYTSSLVEIGIGEKIEVKWHGNSYSGVTNHVNDVYLEVMEFPELEFNRIADTSFSF